MEENNNWSEINKDISEVKNKIKDGLHQDNLTDDLINSFKNTLESASKTFSELMSNIENTVTDEEIKNEAMSVIKKIGTEMEENIKNASSKVSDYFEINKKSEEE